MDIRERNGFFEIKTGTKDFVPVAGTEALRRMREAVRDEKSLSNRARRIAYRMGWMSRPTRTIKMKPVRPAKSAAQSDGKSSSKKGGKGSKRQRKETRQ